jgi:TonB family protein
MHIAAGITILVLSAANFAMEKPPEFVVIPGVGGSRSSGDLKWADSLETAKAEFYCPATSKLADQKVCFSTLVMVTSQAQVPMWCGAVASLNEPDALERRQVEEGAAVHPGDSRPVLAVGGPRSLKVEKFETHCEALPNAPLAPLETPADCNYALRLAAPSDAYYPPAARRQSLTGTVTIEYTLPAQPGSLDRLRVVATSGERDFDAAAMKMYQRARATATCPGVRVRTNVVFKLNDQ